MKVVWARTSARPIRAVRRGGRSHLGRFLDEAQGHRPLDHPGVVPVHELGDRSTRVAPTSRCGWSRAADLSVGLRSRRAERKNGWTPTRALGRAAEGVRGARLCSQPGVVHRDLKPANIMVGRFRRGVRDGLGIGAGHGPPRPEGHPAQGRGQARRWSLLQTLRRDMAEETPDSPLVTMDGDVVGTPAFMSPEQARGRRRSSRCAFRRLLDGGDPLRAARGPDALCDAMGSRDLEPHVLAAGTRGSSAIGA